MRAATAGMHRYVPPTGAIVEGGQVNAQPTLHAFLTQTKGFLPGRKFRKKIGKPLNGCDTCQTVCPKKNNVKPIRIIL
jgi:epoxyqueuosine reductase QueG